MTQKTPRLFNRHKHLLILLDALGGEMRTTDFQKLLFLYCEEKRLPPYEFMPYKFGAFSFTSYSDRRRLIRSGLMKEDDNSWSLTFQGKAMSRQIDLDGRSDIIRFSKKDVCQLRGDELVAKTYREHPFTAIRSTIAKRIFKHEPISLERIESASPCKGLPGIATIGYEGRSVEAYFTLLLNDGVTVLCDVRKNPLSRRYGFSKGSMKKICEGVGIRYEHIPDLGIPSAHRKGLDVEIQREDLFADYEANNLPHRGVELQMIASWVQNGERVALTCFEREPCMCHRSCVSKWLEKQSSDLKPHHL